VTDPSGRISRFSRQEPLLFYQVAPQFVLTRLSTPRSRPTKFFFLLVPGIEPGPPDLYPRTLTTRPQRRSGWLQTLPNSELTDQSILYATSNEYTHDKGGSHVPDVERVLC
jgi:hypothetical protein